MQAYQAEALGLNFGLPNSGVICYFNTLIQSLLSCPVIHQTLVKIRDTKEFASCQVARALLSMWEKPTQSAKFAEEIMACMCKRNINLKSGQQDVSEAFMTLLDLLECIPQIYQLFQHRYQTLIYCTDCEAVVSKDNDLGTLFQIQPNLNAGQSDKFAHIDPTYNKTQSLNDFLMKTNNSTDADFKCPKCNKPGEKFKTTMLQMVPEILPIVLKKYREKVMTDFPEFLEFPSSSSGTKLIYQLVAQCEHSGNQHGGHYWAICRRQQWYMFNDMHVSLVNYGPHPTTYMIWYCYLKTTSL